MDRDCWNRLGKRISFGLLLGSVVLFQGCATTELSPPPVVVQRPLPPLVVTPSSPQTVVVSSPTSVVPPAVVPVSTPVVVSGTQTIYPTVSTLVVERYPVVRSPVLVVGPPVYGFHHRHHHHHLAAKRHPELHSGPAHHPSLRKNGRP